MSIVHPFCFIEKNFILRSKMRSTLYILLTCFLVACGKQGTENSELKEYVRPDSVLMADSVFQRIEETVHSGRAIALSLSSEYEAKGNYDEAFYYSNVYMTEITDSIVMDIAKKYVTDLETKRLNEQLRHRNRELELRLQRQQSIYVTCIALLSLSLLSVLGYRYYRRMSVSMAKKEEEIIRLNEQITSDKNRVAELLAENEALQKEISQYTPTQAQRGLAIVSRLQEAPYLIEKEDMKSIFAVTNQMHKNVLLRLASQYPLLSRIDLSYCCLVFLGFTNAEICTILNVTESAISKWLDRMSYKTSRKRESIYKFLYDFLFAKK